MKQQSLYMRFWLLIGLSLLLAHIPSLDWFFAPLNELAVSIHELSHALMCLVTGGQVNGLTIVPDNSGHGGLTYCQGGNELLITPAGYLGTAIFGSVLVFLSQFPKLARIILFILGTGIGLTSLAFTGMHLFGEAGFLSNLASLVWSLALGVLCVFAALKLKPAAAHLLLLFIAINIAFDSISSIATLVEASFTGLGNNLSNYSDASAMASMTGIPAIMWSLLWIIVSLAAVGLTIWKIYVPQGRKTNTKSRVI